MNFIGERIDPPAGKEPKYHKWQLVCIRKNVRGKNGFDAVGVYDTVLVTDIGYSKLLERFCYKTEDGKRVEWQSESELRSREEILALTMMNG